MSVSAAHSAELFVNRTDVQFFRSVVWTLCAMAAKDEIERPTDGPETKKVVVNSWPTSLPTVFMAS